MKPALLPCLATLALPLFAAEPAAPPPPSPRELLQQGLFEEEANHDPAKAAAAYGALTQQYEALRPMAATALLRQAEILRAQGKGAEAIALYQRVLGEFPAQEKLAARSRERLAELGGAAPGPELPSGAGLTQGEQQELTRLREIARNSPDLLNGDPSQEGKTPLREAAEQGWLEAARFLLDHGVRLESGSAAPDPLLLAASRGFRALVELFLDRGASAGGGNAAGFTPLLAAAENGRLEVARLLLDRGADPNRAKPSGWSPLHAAVRAHQAEMVKLLLERGAHPTSVHQAFPTSLERTEEEGTPLHLAAASGFADLLEPLVARGADPEARQAGGGNTPLLLAALHHDATSVGRLLALGARTDTPNQQGFTPLHAAAQNADGESVRLLLQRGAAVEARENSARLTPLLCSLPAGATLTAELAGEVEAVWQALTAAGADVNARRLPDGRTILHLALEQAGGAANGSSRIVPPIPGSGPSLPTPSRVPLPLRRPPGSGASGLAPRHLQPLLAHGADLNLPDAAGLTPLSLIAALRGESALEFQQAYWLPTQAGPDHVFISLAALSHAEASGVRGREIRRVAGAEAPSLPSLLQEAFLPLADYRTGDLPGVMEALVLRPQAGGLQEVARCRLDFGSALKNLPTLQWGDVVALVKAPGGSGVLVSSIFSRTREAGARPLSAPLHDPPYLTKMVDTPFALCALQEPSAPSTRPYEDPAADLAEGRTTLDGTAILDETALAGIDYHDMPGGAATVELTFTEQGARRLLSLGKVYDGIPLAVLLAGRLVATIKVPATLPDHRLTVEPAIPRETAGKLVAHLQQTLEDGRFLTEVGPRAYFERRMLVTVTVGEGGKLHPQVKAGTALAGLPELRPESPWFIYPENLESVWSYQGPGTLTQVSFHGANVSYREYLLESREVPRAITEYLARKKQP